MKKFFLFLNNEFNHIQIETNYLFDSVKDAYEILNEFFGEEVAKKVKKYGSCEIPEKAGIWYKYLNNK